ncbi:carbamoyltransferase HypF [Geotalea uraniireducens]|uniref:Carbamoyltransferase n=1 Tax=Geotalea uraniireducens TaxID=351604 RepID=A0ABM8ERE7_9BACT|nr:carbamoyltransferase HypF [Geotalea uraniireducens]BDV44788.1 carbamoyltransferase HypF [Geotalea uraniireducens]
MRARPVPSPDTICRPGAARWRITVEGIVQGVGFRPFVFRLATDWRLAGWVKNTTAGVVIEAEGEPAALAGFAAALETQAPPLARIAAIGRQELVPTGEPGFAIHDSEESSGAVRVAPDGDVCPDCLRELFDPADRRYRYPFINCTNCGPRYSIITGIPYDRPKTTMAPFPLCDRCRAEYENPADRRFHAQPVACPVCGPRLRLVDRAGSELAGDPVAAAVDLLATGKIVAVKGLGGFHLAVDATNGEAVAELRRRKRRDEKPFAVMAPGLAEVARFAWCDALESRLLTGPEHPIVLLRKRADNPLAPLVAPTNGYIGTMLPYTPLHHLLLRERFTALVMTSGNLADEPIAYRDDEARQRLAGIADAFLVHDREIHTRTDDSVIRVFRGNPLFLRRSRGYVPREVRLPIALPKVLAVGAELKGTICLAAGERAYLSQHIGDLKNAATLRSLAETAGQLQTLLEIVPELVAHDRHPDYLSTTYAEEMPGLPRVAVQHHHAHLASCMAENGLDGEVIGVIFDGTGLGDDGTVWGGEFLLGGYASYRRAGYFRPVPLPGGDAAVREIFRMALAYLFDAFGEECFAQPLPWLAEIAAAERKLYLQMLARRINSPLTSSCGRLFDAVAALLGLRRQVSYEGQAAIELEALAEESSAEGTYPFSLTSRDGSFAIDFRLATRALVADLASGELPAALARAFHNTVAAAVAEGCGRIRERDRVDRVVLSGGVFQNKLLTEMVLQLLERDGFTVFTHRLVPPNDGGLALGQAMIAGLRVTEKE